jgi:predicted dehydrogenase
MLFGEIAAVSARTWNTHESPFHHAPACFATFKFESGVILSYRASFMSSGLETPWGGIWAANCASGEIVWSSRSDGQGQDDGRVAIRKLGGELVEIALEPLAHKDRAGAIAAFADAVATGTVPDLLPWGSDNIRSLAIVKACLRSGANHGEWVRPADLLPY